MNGKQFYAICDLPSITDTSYIMSHLKAYHGFYLDERNVSANFNFRISMLQKAEDQIWFEL